MSKIRGGAIVAVVLAALMVAIVAPAGATVSSRGPSVVERTQRMTQKAAKLYIARHLKQSTGKYWRYGHDKKIHDCKNLSPIRVRCMVSWYYKEKAYIHGSATAFYKPNDPDHVYLRHDLKVRPI